MKSDFKTVSSKLLLKLHFIVNNSLLLLSKYFSNAFSSEHSRGAAFVKDIKLQGFLKLKFFLLTPQNGQNTQASRQQSTNSLSVFDHFVGLALKRLKVSFLNSWKILRKRYTHRELY